MKLSIHLDPESDEYEIVGHDASCPRIGPYATKGEAQDALRGVERFYKDNPWLLTEETTTPEPTLEEILS